MIECIKKYAKIAGVSGEEDAVRAAIIEDIKDHCSYEVDNLGNLLCFKRGMIAPQKKLLITAHTDEVGFIVTAITDEGLIRFASVGGIDPRVVLGRALFLPRSGVTGVIGTKPVHLQNEKERETVVKVEEMFLDIGAHNRQEAEGVVALGDRAVFLSEVEDFGDGYLKGKALDDRIGCAIMVELIKSKLKFDTYFAFLVQEEVGLRGAKVAVNAIAPDVAIVIEATTAADLPGVAEHKKVCSLGKGAVVSFMDNSTIYDKGLFDLARKLAVEHKITAQTKTMVAGGNDAGAIHIGAGGVRTIAVSAPTRYLHTGATVVKKEDVICVAKLVRALAENVV